MAPQLDNAAVAPRRDGMSSMPADAGEVLVVDDAADSLAYLSELLQRGGYTTRAAPNGELALWSASHRCPDLILLDVRMPGVDGFEVCRRLKADPRTAAVPVIFLSTQSETDDRIRGFEAGGVDFIAKPLVGEEVLHRVAAYVRLSRAMRVLAENNRHLEACVAERTQQLRLAASAFDSSLSASFITTPDGILAAINPAFTALTGYAGPECLGQTVSLLNSGKHPEEFFADFWRQLRAAGKWSGEIWNRRKDGNVFPCLLNVTAVRDDKGDIANFVGVFLDLSESKDAAVLIDFLTRHDPLTGLPNRVLVRDRFEQLANGLATADSLAVICVNLHRFRFINDFHGYAVGNQVLQWMAGRIAETAPSKDTVFRESGDEFILVHRDGAGLLGVQLLIEALRDRLNGEVRIDGATIEISTRIGIALYPTDGATLEELAGNASIAMQRAGMPGGDRYAFFAERIDQGVRARFDIAQRLRHAIEQGEFEVHYQPQVDAASGRIVAAEALLRWRSGELGMIPPGQFIPIAEETGHIVPIGAWVLRTVCLQIAAWHTAGLGWIKVAVNISAIQFMQPDLADTVREALATSGIPPDRLELEITESALISDVERTLGIMRGFRAMGLSLSLDDFGTGYSSLSYLKRFPIGFLKIDQSFVRDLLADSDAGAIVLSIIGLAHNMHMRVIAEGVETEAQRAFLAAHGCDLLQGYLFSKPLPAAHFGSRLALVDSVPAATP